MSSYIITPPAEVKGTVEISGSKNAALPIITAALLPDGATTLTRVPHLSDTKFMQEIISILGHDCSWDDNQMTIIPASRPITDPPMELMSKLRASFLIMGPVLAKYGHIRIPYPGGCKIGARPIDLHLKGFSAMGTELCQGHGYVEATCNHLEGADIYLDFPSVGATENLMMAACLARGITNIENAAAEPEILDLAEFLMQCGAEIEGAGSDRITITGTDHLSPCQYEIIPDRIEAGTFLAIAAAAHGHLDIQNIRPAHLKPMTAKLEEMGVNLTIEEKSIEIDASAPLSAVDIKTLPYPGFPTDLQPQMTALLSLSKGTGIVVETIFENRFMHIPELVRMGANIKVDGRTAVIDGVSGLTGAEVRATDLRAGAALTIAALSANDATEIIDIEHIERGYENFPEKLNKIGISVYKK